MAKADKTKRIFVTYELSGTIKVEIPDIEYANDEETEKAILRELSHVNILAFVKNSHRPQYKSWGVNWFTKMTEFKKQHWW